MGTGKLIAIIVGVVLLLLLMLVPARFRGEAKRNRVRCVNNCSQIYRAMLAFAQDNGERMPWQLTVSGVRNHLDSGASPQDTYGLQYDRSINEVDAHPNMLQTAGVWGLRAVKPELITPKILLSPCDPTRAMQNELVQQNWSGYNTEANGVSAELGGGTSYTLVRGADTQRPSSVLAVTRNWSGDNLGSGRWLGSDSDKSNNRTMDGLNKSQGQMVMMDGSAKQANDADFGGTGQITRAAGQATGGVAKGETSLNILRGAGL